MKQIHTYSFRTIAGCIVLLFFFCGRACAQHKLKEVKVKHRKDRKKTLQDDRLEAFTPGMKVLTIDSALMEQYALQHVGQLLSRQVPVFIKSYGINSMATLSFRGSSSAQSQLLWNGVPINNTSLGVADVSLVGVHQFDDIHVLYGGASALSGSGNVGAALLVNNRFEHMGDTARWQGRLLAEAGSFNQYHMAVKERFQTKKLFLELKASGQYARNDFSYTDQKAVQQRMDNAQLKGGSVMLHGGYLFRGNTQLKAAAWYQHVDREIPPALFETQSVKQQQDKSLRLFVECRNEPDQRRTVYAKTALTRDVMQYTDTLASQASENRTWQSYTELGWKKVFDKRHEWLLFLPVNISWMHPERDSQIRVQYKLALASAYVYRVFDNRLQLAANFRAEQINEQSVGLPGANISYALFPQWKLRANVQRSYRAPTLNEWYYTPGGNPALKPEQGWSQDAGYELRLPLSGGLLLLHDASVFNRKIKDWILWFGGSVWTPHNIAAVRSRGIETSNSLTWNKGKWQARAGLNTSFVRAITEESYIPGDGSIGKQIPYVPRYNIQADAGITYGQLTLNYNHVYTGYRFITTDESQFLEPYQTGNVYFSWKRSFGKIRGIFSLQCNNLWNAQYQVVNLRPMPGRNVAAGISCTF